MIRPSHLAALLLVPLVTALPLRAGEAPGTEGCFVDGDVDLAPGAFAALRYDAAADRLVPESGFLEPPAPKVRKTLDRVPAWIRPALGRALARLPFEPLVAAEDARPFLTDLDGDGRADLVLYAPSGPALRAFLAPRFEEDAARFRSVAPRAGSQAAFADMDGDGTDDLVLLGPGPGLVFHRGPAFAAPVSVPGPAALAGCSFLAGMALRVGDAPVACLIGVFPDGTLKAQAFREGRPLGAPRDLAVPAELRAPGRRIAGLAVADLVIAPDGAREILAWSEDGDAAGFAGPAFERELAGLAALRLGKGSRAAAGDVTGDALADLLVVEDDGSVVVIENRGTRAEPWFPREHAPAVRFPMEPGVLPRPAFGDLDGDGVADLLVGTKEGWLRAYRGPDWGTWDAAAAKPRCAGDAAPALGDVDGDGALDLLLGGKGGAIRFFRGPDFTEEPLAGLEQGEEEFPVPALCDLDGDGVLDLLVGRHDGVVRVYRGLRGGFEPWADHPVAARSFGRAAAPAAADLDGDGAPELVVGTLEGKLFVVSASTGQDDARWLGDADIGELSSPAVADLDGDGKPDLAAACVRGAIHAYRNRGDFLQEFESWVFRPEPETPDLEACRRRFLPFERPLLAAVDGPTLDRVLAILDACEEGLLDEVAFALAHTPAEVVRAMVRLGHGDLFQANAAAIRDMAAKLPYVSLVEADDGRTTLEYRRSGGAVERIPPETYYWWVVHPRLLYEIPARVDPSWWSTKAGERGMKEEDWLKHEPETSVYEPGPESAFWRLSLPDDRSCGTSLFEVVSGKETLEEAQRALHDWLTPGRPGTVMTFGYLTRDLQPLVIFRKRYGSCGEQSVIGAACARAVLIAASIVTDRGEDHQWNEFWMGGAWHHWDVCHAEGVDAPWGSTEGPEHKGKTVTAVLRWRGDDVQEPVTTTVHNDPENPYTASGAGYTDTARVTVKVADAKGRPLDGALVLFRSHWNDRNMIGHWGYTGPGGAATLDVGFQANGGYTVEVFSAAGCAGVGNFAVTEGRSYTLELAVPGVLPPPASHTVEPGPGPRTGGRASLTLDVSAVLHAKNLVTGIRPVKPGDRAKAHVWKTARYRGTVSTALPLPGDPLLVGLCFDAAQYERFRRGEDASAFHAFEALPRRPEELRLPDGARVVLLNLMAGTHARGRLRAQTLREARDPVLALDATAAELPSGGVVEIQGTATDNVAVEALEWSLDGSSWFPAGTAPDAGGRFAFSWRAGRDGPFPPGSYTLTVRARDPSGRTARAAVPLKVTPSSFFPAQPVRQDDPNSPLPRCSWMLGPFELPEGERFVEILTRSDAAGFDMDLFLFHDKNGNGILDGTHEQAAASSSPLPNERIFLTDPKGGIYWVFCQGWKVESGTAPLDVRLSFVPRMKIVSAFAPCGFVRELPAAIRASLAAPSGLAAGSARVTVDGRDVTGQATVGEGIVSVPLPLPQEEGKPVRVEVRARDRAGNEDASAWSFTLDRTAPRVTIAAPGPGEEITGTFTVKARVEEACALASVTLRLDEGKGVKLVLADGVWTGALDATKLAAGRHALRVEAVDAAGNRDFEALEFHVRSE